MTELQGRGYLIAHSAKYLRDKIGETEWARTSSQLSPELQQVLAGEVKHAGWYPLSLLNEITRQITTVLGRGEDEAAREALYQCGRFCANEASNTFLKLLLKLLTPSMFAKKLPDVFRRDFTAGKLVAELNGTTLTCRYHDMGDFHHCVCMGPGFAAAALETMGKKISKVAVYDWSLAKPNVEGARFELTWTD